MKHFQVYDYEGYQPNHNSSGKWAPSVAVSGKWAPVVASVLNLLILLQVYQHVVSTDVSLLAVLGCLHHQVSRLTLNVTVTGSTADEELSMPPHRHEISVGTTSALFVRSHNKLRPPRSCKTHV
jgi:hypothetical protein